MKCLARLHRHHSCRYLHIARESVKDQKYDVIVIGGGHAGCESAAASARCGARTLMVTQSTSTIGSMPCNPSFGGNGKGHLMREVDAMDGVSARVCDQSAVTYKVLNETSGPALLGIRAQIDRQRYPRLIQEELLRKTPNLDIVEASVEDLILESNGDRFEVRGCVLDDGTIVLSESTVITTGTFLRGELFCGRERRPGGRRGESATYGLSAAFQRFGVELLQFRTGTSPRIYKKTVDFSDPLLTEILPDKVSTPFSFLTKRTWLSPEEQLSTYLGHTNPKIIPFVLEGAKDSLFVDTEAQGPRYCPSLISKVRRFPHLAQRYFIEPEGLESDQLYLQGMGISVPSAVQLKILRELPGMKNVEIAHPGYGVTYDCVNPKQLNADLSLRMASGLYLAGQINGTTGYEEAACQGLIAGINAAWNSKRIRGFDVPEKPLVIDRCDGYTGVLIDDLTSLGTAEPYRMFSSRVEFRLLLRPENADMRLTELARAYGAVSDERWLQYCDVKRRFTTAKELLCSVEMPASKWRSILKERPNGKALIRETKQNRNAFQLLSRHEVTLDELHNALPETFASLRDWKDDKDLAWRLYCDSVYALPHSRLINEMEQIRKEQNTLLPTDLDYSQIHQLSVECREKLAKYRPANLAAASRIQGLKATSMVVLLQYAKRSAVLDPVLVREFERSAP